MKFVNSRWYLALRNSPLSVLLRPIWRYFYMFVFSPRKLKNYADPMLKTVKELFETNDINYWLDFGTLLGAIRNHDFISYDGDIDLAVIDTDASKVVETLKNCSDLVVTHEYWVKDQIAQISCEYNGLNMDVCFYHQDAGNPRLYFCYLCYYDKDISTKVEGDKYQVAVLRSSAPYVGTKEYDFKGMNVRIPQNEDEYLIANYGPNYMVPNKNWDYMNDAPNLYKYSTSELQGTCVLFR